MLSPKKKQHATEFRFDRALLIISLPSCPYSPQRIEMAGERSWRLPAPLRLQRVDLFGKANDAELKAAIEQVWAQRSDRYSEVRSEATANLPKVEMSYIGG